MSDTAWVSLANIIVTVCGVLAIWLKASHATSLGESNAVKLDNVIQQTNGMSKHLVQLAGEAGEVKGAKRERDENLARAERPSPFEVKLGIDSPNAGRTDRPA